MLMGLCGPRAQSTQANATPEVTGNAKPLLLQKNEGELLLVIGNWPLEMY